MSDKALKPHVEWFSIVKALWEKECDIFKTYNDIFSMGKDWSAFLLLFCVCFSQDRKGAHKFK